MLINECLVLITAWILHQIKEQKMLRQKIVSEIRNEPNYKKLRVK